MDSIKVGNKVEIFQKEEKINLYSTGVIESIIDDSTVIIALPILNDKHLKLKLGEVCLLLISEYNVVFSCDFKINKIFKENHNYHIQINIISELVKLQRRNYFRHSCFLSLKFILIFDQHTGKIKEMFKGIIVDISGGGMKFISNEDLYLGGPNLKCFFIIKSELIAAIGKILDKKPLSHKQYKFQYRLKFITILPDNQEKIIAFIFNEQRKKINVLKNE